MTGMCDRRSYPEGAWLLTSMGKVPDGFDASVITLSGIVHNLVPVTLGNRGRLRPGRRRVLDDLSGRVRRRVGFGEAIDRCSHQLR
jgi:hypothetical protein